MVCPRISENAIKERVLNKVVYIYVYRYIYKFTVYFKDALSLRSTMKNEMTLNPL